MTKCSEGGPATENPGGVEGGPATDNVGEQKLKHTEKAKGRERKWHAERPREVEGGHCAGLPATHVSLSIFLLSCEGSVSFLTQGGLCSL